MFFVFYFYVFIIHINVRFYYFNAGLMLMFIFFYVSFQKWFFCAQKAKCWRNKMNIWRYRWITELVVKYVFKGMLWCKSKTFRAISFFVAGENIVQIECCSVYFNFPFDVVENWTRRICFHEKLQVEWKSLLKFNVESSRLFDCITDCCCKQNSHISYKYFWSSMRWEINDPWRRREENKSATKIIAFVN